MTNSIKEKIVRTIILSESILKTYTSNYEKFYFKTTKLSDEERKDPRGNPNQIYYAPYVEYTINGVTDWNLTANNMLGKKSQRNPNLQMILNMESKIRDILSEITLELSEFYKDKTLPQNITITVDVVKREATMTIDGKPEKPFSLDLVENETTAELKKPKLSLS